MITLCIRYTLAANKLADFEAYAKLASDPDAAENLRRAERAGCILIEDRSILRRVEPVG
jgi:hypothetical protein